MRAAIVGAFVLAAACGGKKDEAKRGADDAEGESKAKVDLVAQLRGLADRACACKDRTCTSALEHDYDAWETEARKQPKPGEAEIAQINAEGERLDGCTSKFDPCDCKDMACFESVFADLTEAQRADPHVQECREVLLKYPPEPTKPD